jgi:uncharacterized protein YbcV (DUF1398 family)
MELSQIQNLLAQTLAAQVTFPQILQTLTAAGYESYHVDLLRHEYRYYQPDGRSHRVTPDLPPHPAAQAFNTVGVQAAIRLSQAGKIQYREFIRLALEAGCVYYVVYLTGRKVVYFGRHGETHTENFPPK